MSWGTYGILIILGLFVLLLIFNPRLSCFGKRVRSPLYPLFRKKRMVKKAHEYDFHLVEGKPRGESSKGKPPAKKPEDYGFKLD